MLSPMKFSKYTANTFLDSGNDSFHSHSSFCASAFPVVTLIIGVEKKLVSKFIVTLLFMIHKKGCCTKLPINQIRFFYFFFSNSFLANPFFLKYY